MSSTLYSRRVPVFERAAANRGCILDARLHWTLDAKINRAPTPDIEHGQTVVSVINYDPGTSIYIKFTAKHPLSDTYYATGIKCDTYIDNYQHYVVSNKVYVADTLIYSVRSLEVKGKSVYSSLNWQGGYILISIPLLNGDDSADQPIVGDIIEPFNVIFDPPYSAETLIPRITDSNKTAVSMAGEYLQRDGQLVPTGNIFTNNPLVNGTSVVPYCNFSITGDELSLALNEPKNSSEKVPGIRTINGLAAEQGNINIQLLG